MFDWEYKGYTGHWTKNNMDSYPTNTIYIPFNPLEALQKDSPRRFIPEDRVAKPHCHPTNPGFDLTDLQTLLNKGWLHILEDLREMIAKHLQTSKRSMEDSLETHEDHHGYHIVSSLPYQRNSDQLSPRVWTKKGCENPLLSTLHCKLDLLFNTMAKSKYVSVCLKPEAI